MKSFVVGGGVLLGVRPPGEKSTCGQCGIAFADEEPCFVCGQPVCRHCAHDLGTLGHCCAGHGNVNRALSREYTVEVLAKKKGTAPASPDGGPGTLDTAYYRSKDDAERALRFLAAMEGIFRIERLDFVRDLGCAGNARFDVWRALGRVAERAASQRPTGQSGRWTRESQPPGELSSRAGFLR